MMKKVFILFILGCLVLPLEAQNSSTQGKEFWLSFMHNGFKDHDMGGWVINQVLISAKRDCSGSISNPLTGWATDFNVSANNTTIVEIPETQGYHNGSLYETIAQKGLKVESSDTISVYCTNIAYVSFDASFVLPVESLGDEYYIQSYDQSRGGSTNAYVYNNETSAFLIVATEDNTEIEITPNCPTLGGRPANETFTITMNAGETYHLRSVRTGVQRDLSGTHILAADCKRIAVFNGNTVTCIPFNQGNGYDHVFEQAMPLRSWGKKFVVTSSRNRNRDFIKITSSANNNVVTINGAPLITLGARESYTFDMYEAEGSCFLEATQPSAVYLYNNSSYDRFLGDPSMVWIAPVEQRINDVTFSTFDHPDINIDTHSVNIIVNTEDIANVYFDGQQISPLLFTQVNGNHDYSYTRMDISHDVHRISCANGFNAHVYGFGDAKGYAYLVGSNAINLSSSLTLNNEVILPNESFSYCPDEPIIFHAEVNIPEYNLLWDFGDGTTSNQNLVAHIYNERRTYNVSLAITTNEGGCTGSSSNTTNFIVDTRQQYITESDEVCAGELYSGFGFSNVHINNDTILVRLQDNPLHGVCQDSVLVYITSHPNYHIPFNDSRCWHGQPGVYDGHGFSFVYDQPGIYDRQLNLQTIDGCDSIISLHLIVDNQITYEFDTVTCSEFIWDNTTYTETEDIVHTYSTPNGCDSIVTCHLEVGGLIQGDTLYHPDCDSYIWYDTEYSETGFYSKEFTTSLGCDSIVYLDLKLAYTPNPEKIQCTTPGAIVFGLPNADADTVAVVTNTEFFSFQYTFKVKESEHNETECPWTHCDWTISKPSWSIEYDPTPKVSDGKYYSECTVYVAEHDDDYVILTATMSNGCGSKQCKFYLKSSFLDIDEQNISLSDFNVIPNPNNGKMTLNFVNMTGKIDLKVYDLHGTLIDQFQIISDASSYSVPYQPNSLAEGLYFFVATGQNKVLTKKVIIYR